MDLPSCSVLAALAALSFASLPTVPSNAGLPASPTPSASASALAEPSTIVRDGFTYAHRAVETHDAEAQFDFDRGLTLLYAFDPAAARKAFEAAGARDPSLAMAQWGIALSHGPNINTDFDSASQRLGREAIARAHALESAATPADRALIDAAVKRFASDRTADADAVAQSYRDAMQRAATAFPDDDDVAVLAAEAALDVHPWEYFDDDGTAKPWTPAIIARLQTVLARDPHHVGANHYMIHADEESGKTEAALPAARALFAERFEPAAEHLEHMPAHIFMQTGDYHDAGVANERAVDDFLRYRANDDGSEADHEGYFGHDCEFGIQGFAMAGERERASALATKCERPRYAMETDLRFGRYAQAFAADPTDETAAGFAALAAGDLEAAQRHLEKIKPAQGPGAIARDVLAARIAQHRNDAAKAATLLESAVAAQDALGYSEPPRFFYPVRETLGAAYFRAGDFARAERVFRADLAKNDDNPRSLFGLAATLAREGKSDDAAKVRERFELAWQHADSTLDVEEL